MANKLKIDRKHYLLENELNKKDIDQEIDQYLVSVREQLSFDLEPLVVTQISS